MRYTIIIAQDSSNYYYMNENPVFQHVRKKTVWKTTEEMENVAKKNN